MSYNTRRKAQRDALYEPSTTREQRVYLVGPCALAFVFDNGSDLASLVFDYSRGYLSSLYAGTSVRGTYASLDSICQTRTNAVAPS